MNSIRNICDFSHRFLVVMFIVVTVFISVLFTVLLS